MSASCLRARAWQAQTGSARERSSAIGLAAGLALLLAATPAFAQSGRVVGRVTSAESGAPIGDVQVFIAGTGLGTLTRQNGTFVLLEVPAGNHQVRAERIGFTSISRAVTVVAGQPVEASFQLATQALGLDEIVVTGTAGAARRREVGNSIAQINVAQVAAPPRQVADMLSAAAPGIEINVGTPQVGQGTRIRLRGGNTSMTQSNSPIIYVDGIRIQSTAFQQETFGDSRPRVSGITPSPLNEINPNDIERIEVIKGAAASTLYGTEASAGVIQIFTKRGSSGAPIWEGEIQQGALRMRRFGPAWEPYLRMDYWLKTGYTQMYSASVRAGTELLQYFLSGQRSNDTGTLPDNTGETWAARGNFTATPANGLTFQWNSAYTNQHLGTTAICGCGEGLVLNAVQAEVNYYGTADPKVISQSLQWHIDHLIDRFTTGGTATYSPLANLTNRLTIGFDYSQSEERNFRPVGFPFWPLGALYVSKFENRQTTFDYVGTYRFNVIRSLTSSFSWGGQAVSKEQQTNAAWGEEFPGAALPTTSSAAKTTAYENLSKIWNAGFFFQNIFGLGDRYFLTLGMRVDGNSAFGSGFGLQMYPKASASWVISDEGWWRHGLGQLKLRTAYGRSGQAPGAFDAVRTWQGQGFVGSTAFTPRNVGNPDLGPEVSAEFEAGFDGSWLNDRLTANVTYYKQTTTNALFNVTNIPSKGFLGSQRLNVGKTQSTGLELSVNGVVIQRSAFGWDVGMDVTTAHSKVLDLGGGPSFSLGSDNWVVQGEPAPVRKGRVVTNPDAIADPVYKDTIIGPALPTHIIAGNMTVRIPAGISISFRGDYRGGNYYYGNAPIERSVRWPRCFPYYQYPQGKMPDGSNNLALKSDTPALWRARCTPTAFGHDIWMVPADYFRVRNLSATIPVGFALPDRIKNATLTVGGYNWWTWYNKDFLDYDPEEGATEGLTASSGPPSLGTNISWRAALQFRF